jgi:aminoglycoside phosphotransferase (APT) family kinase protein
MATKVAAWVELLGAPRCLWHGDFRLDNMLFDACDGTVPIAVFDWQTVALGPPTLDVAFFLGSALTERLRREHEERLVRRYHAGLVGHGVRDYSWDECWRDYRAHALCGFLGAMLGASRAVRTQRGDRLLLTMARRHGQQILDLRSFEAVDR